MLKDWRPDWRNEEAYAGIAFGDQLAWEFLRRNEQYARDWRQDPRDSIEEIDGVMVWQTRPSDAAIDEYDRLRRQYMVFALYHPSTSPDKVVFDFFRTPWQNFAGTSGDPDIQIRSSSEVVVKFNLDFSLDAQLKFAAWNLKDLRKNQQTDVRIKKDINIYLRYLRFLDGKHTGATFYELGNALFSEPANPNAAAKEALKAAHEFCDWKYKQLVGVRTIRRG